MSNGAIKRVPMRLEKLFSQVVNGHGEKILSALIEEGLITRDGNMVIPPLTDKGLEKLAKSLHNGIVEVFANADVLVPVGVSFDEVEPLRDILDSAGEAHVQITTDGSGLFGVEFNGKNPIVSKIQNLSFNPESIKGQHAVDVETVKKLMIVASGIVDERPQIPGVTKPGKLLH